MKDIKKNIIINVLIIAVAIFLFKGISYSAENKDTMENKDVLIKTVNMQVVLNVPSEKYNFLDTLTESASDSSGLNKKGYDFSITNTGSIPIEYYEIRLVDQEGKVSTLPHKYLRFTINKDNGKYEDVKNLGDNDSILYYGYNLDVGKSSTFNLKMWVDGEEADILGKELYGAIEVTLYQKFDVYKNYVLYESDDSTNVPIRTSIYNPISNMIPKRDGYKFLYWEKSGGGMKYNSGDTYRENVGTTLYAVWEKE